MYVLGGHRFLTTYLNADTLRKLPEYYVFDETQSVKWNREKVVEHNDLAVKAKKDYYDQVNIVDKEFADMVKKKRFNLNLMYPTG